MKFCFYSLLLVAFVSCSGGYSKRDLLGGWTTIEDPKFPKNGVLDKMTFGANDTVLIEFYQNGVLRDRMALRYTMNEKEGYITTIAGDTSFRSDITELTAEKLTTRQSGTERLAHFRKLP